MEDLCFASVAGSMAGAVIGALLVALWWGCHLILASAAPTIDQLEGIVLVFAVFGAIGLPASLVVGDIVEGRKNRSS
jgi:hypothetical protein